tara:strand:- start:644 stop:1750 length:1107 start_codon:yes stop_codon:yes gene_type:complete
MPTVKQLKASLTKHGLATNGLKAALATRLAEYEASLSASTPEPAAAAAAAAEPESSFTAASPAPTAPAPVLAPAPAAAAAAPAAPAAPAASATAAPAEPEHAKRTLHVTNFNDTVLTNLDGRLALHDLFARHGQLLEVVNSKRYRHVAWVVFESPDSAIAALAALQGYYFIDRPLHLEFAEVESDILTKREGTFQPREPWHKRRRVETPALAAQAAEETAGDGTAPMEIGDAAYNPAAAAAGAMSVDGVAPPLPPLGMLPPGYVASPRHAAAAAPAAPANAAAAAANAPLPPGAMPNRKLICAGLTATCTREEIETLFKAHAGYVEIDLFVKVKNLAIVAFADARAAANAMKAMQAAKVDFKISFALH